MTFKDLIDKGEGTIYLVKKGNPTTVSEIDCICVSKKVAYQRDYFYYSFHYYSHPDNEYIIARKSKDKKRILYGYPLAVSISSSTEFIELTRNNFNETKHSTDKYIVFLDKEEACNYVIDKIKRKKLELNGKIIAINKLKFSIK